MSEWISVSKTLPQEGKIVDIKIIGGSIIRNVLYEMGRFWKKRIGKSAGIAWTVTDWAYPEKVKKASAAKKEEVFDETIDNQEK